MKWDFFRAKNVRQGAKADHFPAFVDVGWVHAESLASAKAAQRSGPRKAVCSRPICRFGEFVSDHQAMRGHLRFGGDATGNAVADIGKLLVARWWARPQAPRLDMSHLPVFIVSQLTCPARALLHSQFEALEEPGLDEKPITISIEPKPREIVAQILSAMNMAKDALPDRLHLQPSGTHA
jgi:hypothetical protein